MTMNWVGEQLGASAVLSPGMGLKDHARAAIQILSGAIIERQVYAHTGWRKLPNGVMVFLHADGALGQDGPVDGVEVELSGDLAKYKLPSGEGDPIEAVQATLRMLDLAPGTIVFPLLGAIFRAVYGGCDFSLFLAGATGVGKSELAALAQQHFGAEMDRLHLPSSWSSTANALEATAFKAKDVLQVVDDFAPGGSMYDVQKLHREADRLLRGQGNLSGRQRMRSDTTLRPIKPPRGLILSTGEDTPHGQSLRARVLLMELGPKALDFTKLTAAQKDARGGLYARDLAGFIRWLAGRYPVDFKTEVARLRDQVMEADSHRRTPDIVANLAYGFRSFLDYALAAKAISEKERARLWEQAWSVFLEVARMQSAHQASAEPVQRFFELLGSALASGRAHMPRPVDMRPRSRVPGAGVRLMTSLGPSAIGSVGWMEPTSTWNHKLRLLPPRRWGATWASRWPLVRAHCASGSTRRDSC